MPALFPRFLAAVAGMVTVLVLLGGGALAAPTPRGARALPRTSRPLLHGPATPVITPGGVGAVRIGASVKSLLERGLIGALRKGCELDPGQKVAPLRAPLRGWAIFRSDRPDGSGLLALTVEGGAETARHIGIGSTATEARKAYPDALYEAPGTMKPFAEGFLWVPNLSKPKLTMIIAPETRKVEAISVPSPDFCE